MKKILQSLLFFTATVLFAQEEDSIEDQTRFNSQILLIVVH